MIIVESVEENALVDDLELDGGIKLIDDRVELKDPPEDENAMKNLLIELHQDEKLMKPLLGLVRSSFTSIVGR